MENPPCCPDPAWWLVIRSMFYTSRVTEIPNQEGTVRTSRESVEQDQTPATGASLSSEGIYHYEGPSGTGKGGGN